MTARASYVVSSVTAPFARFFGPDQRLFATIAALNAGENSSEEGTHVLREHKLLAASPPVCMYV